MKSDNCSLYLTCLFLIILAFGSPALTQPLIFQDPVTARTFQSEKYSGIRGTPFLEEDWMAGWVQVPQGVYKNLRLKIDLYSNTLYFNKNDELWEFQDPVKSFVLFPDASDSTKFREYKKGVNGGGLREDQFVQVLGEGKVSLYRSDIKLLSEMSEINAGMVKTFTNSTRYFIKKDNNMQLIKLNKKELLAVLKDKEEQILAFVKENDLSFTKDEDAKLIIRYYNML